MWKPDIRRHRAHLDGRAGWVILHQTLKFLVAWLMVTFINDTYRMTWPTPDYFAALGLSLLLALGAVTATFSLVRGNTAMTVTRFE